MGDEPPGASPQQPPQQLAAAAGEAAPPVQPAAGAALCAGCDDSGCSWGGPESQHQQEADSEYEDVQEWPSEDEEEVKEAQQQQGGDDDGWNELSEGEEQQEGDQPEPNSDKLVQIWDTCARLVKACFGPLFGIKAWCGDGLASSKRGRSSDPSEQPPVCMSAKCRGKPGAAAAAAAQPDGKWKASVTFAKAGKCVGLTCRRCRDRKDVCKGIRDICEGDVIWLVRGSVRQHYLIRSFIEDLSQNGSRPQGGTQGGQPGVLSAGWHVQPLSTDLLLPATGLAANQKMKAYPIHSAGIFVLRRNHTEVSVQKFVSSWACGEAGVLPRSPAPVLFYQSEGVYDVLSVPLDCPTYDTSGCSCRCKCLNPWAARGGSGAQSFRHRTCPNSGGQQGANLAEGGGEYSAGDLAWLQAPGSAEVDAEAELVRIQELFPFHDESQDSLQMPSTVLVWHVQYERYRREGSAAGFVFHPTGEVARCLADRLWRKAGLATLPPYVWMEGAAAADGSRGGGKAASTAAEAGGGAGGAPGSCPGAGGDATPSGTDVNAAPMCRSDSGSEAESFPGSGGSGGAVAQRPVVICDIFSGCGGLSLGLEDALPHASARWANDIFEQALQTYADCHPEARTFFQDACDFLAGVRRGADGYPPKGESDKEWRVLVGGPPCQGFSKANKGDMKEKGRKNILLCLYLTILAELQWPYAIIENVTGLLSAGETMQCTLQCLASLGYQCSFRLLNAGSYGTAQHRRRVILLAAKHGYPLPFHPAPTHVFQGAGGYTKARTCSLEARRRVARAGVPTAWWDNVVVPNVAPLPALTALDVIGDLPAECSEVYGAPAAGERAERSISRYYWARLRGGAAVGAELHNHETWELQADTKERLAALPKEGQPAWERGAGAWPGPPQHPFRPSRASDWRAWILRLIPQSLVGKQDDPKTWGRFGRLLWCSHFATCLTCPQLNSDTTSTTVHPTADRPLTGRECGRVQGFPDHVRFRGTTAQCYKQVGNAVPPPLAAAIGRELGAALRLAEQQQQQKVRRR